MFRFKYRQAGDSLQDFARRNDRMVSRHLERYEKSGMKEVLHQLSAEVATDGEKADQLTKKWVEF